jgi:hypothetical protein
MAFADDPVDFMEHNVVLVGNVADQSGLYNVKLNAQSAGVYKLERGDGGGSFPAYWCHYKPDSTHYVAASVNADFLFTPRMNGCSFAVGIPAGDGTVVVAHSNVRDRPATEAIRNVDLALNATPIPPMAELVKLQTLRRQLVMVEQKEKLETAIGGDQFTAYLSSTTYQSAELTTFGVRDTGAGDWSFYFQARTGNTPAQIMGCFRIGGRTASTGR